MTTKSAALALAATALIASAAQAQAPARPGAQAAAPAVAPARFVRMDTNGDLPSYWDAASVKRDGDIVSVELLTFAQGLDLSPNQPPKPRLTGETTRYRISCAWRAVLGAKNAQVYTDGKLIAPRPLRHDGADTNLLSPWSDLSPLLDRLCAGEAPPTGGASLAAAVADALAEPPPPLTALPIAPRRPDPVFAYWMKGDLPHRFAPVATGAPDGALLFIDQEGLVRQGDQVETLSLVVLGAQAQRRAGTHARIVALRQTTYDCAARTVTVQAQASWNRYGEFQDQDETPYTPRGAAQSPLLAAEIAAACATPAPDAAAFASVDDAWAYARQRLPAAPPPAWSFTCVWNALPAAARTQALAAWPADGAAVAALRTAMPQAMTACHAPAADKDLGQARLTTELDRRGGAAALTRARGLDEARLQAVWNGLAWRERQRLTRMLTFYDRADRAFSTELLYRLGYELALTSDQEREWLGAFLRGQAAREAAGA